MTTTAAPPSTALVPVDDLTLLLPDWRTNLRARNIAPSTISSYLTVADNLLAYLHERGMPTRVSAITREHLEAFLADLGDRVAAATTARHYRSLQQLFRWLSEDGEVLANPMTKMRPPRVPLQPVEVLTDDDLVKLLASAKGHTFEQRRDTALLRILIDTGVRASELIGLGVDDFDDNLQVFHVMGKGRRGRAVPFNPKTADALRRYRRIRVQHPSAASSAFWLGRKGPLTTSGLAQVLERRAADAGVPDVHPHRFRHTFAHRWLADGGQEHDLMRLAGWQSPQMVGRYAASAGAERAREAFHRAALGDRV